MTLILLALVTVCSAPEPQPPDHLAHTYKDAAFFGAQKENSNGVWQARVLAYGSSQGAIPEEISIGLKRTDIKPNVYAVALTLRHPDYPYFHSRLHNTTWRWVQISTKGNALRIIAMN